MSDSPERPRFARIEMPDIHTLLINGQDVSAQVFAGKMRLEMIGEGPSAEWALTVPFAVGSFDMNLSEIQQFLAKAAEVQHA